jgi:hypothetical protein
MTKYYVYFTHYHDGEYGPASVEGETKLIKETDSCQEAYKALSEKLISDWKDYTLEYLLEASTITDNEYGLKDIMIFDSYEGFNYYITIKRKEEEA